MKAKEPPPCIFMKVVRKGDSVAYEEDRSNKRLQAIQSWWELLGTDLEASAVGRQVIAEAPHASVAAFARELLDATFALKSPGTLLKRLGSVRGYVQWCKESGQGNWLPLVERTAWEYVRHLRETGAPATRA